MGKCTNKVLTALQNKELEKHKAKLEELEKIYEQRIKKFKLFDGENISAVITNELLECGMSILRNREPDFSRIIQCKGCNMMVQVPRFMPSKICPAHSCTGFNYSMWLRHGRDVPVESIPATSDDINEAKAEMTRAIEHENKRLRAIEEYAKTIYHRASSDLNLGVNPRE